MSHKDHEYRTKLIGDVTKGLPKNYGTEVHRSLEKNYGENKDEMEYDELLDVVKEVMNDHRGWSWNGQKWIEDKKGDEDE